MRTLASLLLLFPAVSLLAQEAPPLRLSFAVGQTRYYEFELNRRTSIDQGGQQRELSLQIDVTLAMKIAAVKDGKADIAVTIHHFAMQQAGANAVVYDTDKPGPVPRGAAKALETYGGMFHISLDDRARSSGYRLPDRGDGMMVMVDYTALESCLRQALPELPDAAVAKGGSWESSFEAIGGLLAGDKVQLQNKLLSLDAGKASIEQQLQLEPGKVKIPAGSHRDVKTCRGSSVVDLQSGLPEHAELDMLVQIDSLVGNQKLAMTTATKWALRQVEAPKEPPPPLDADQHFTCIEHTQIDTTEPGVCPVCKRQLVVKPGSGGR